MGQTHCGEPQQVQSGKGKVSVEEERGDYYFKPSSLEKNEGSRVQFPGRAAAAVVRSWRWVREGSAFVFLKAGSETPM